MSQTMKHERMYQVILRPHISEKANTATELNRQFVFCVAKQATKPQIKHAVETLFKVKVRSVQVSHTKTKPRRVGKVVGRSKSWKKAYVALHEGFDIDFTGSFSVGAS